MKKKRKKKLLLVICILIILPIFIFWHNYKLDIKLFINEIRVHDEQEIEKIITIKAVDLLYRLSHCYNNNDSMDELDNYFDKNCDIHLLNSNYNYNKDIRNKILKSIRNRRKLDQSDMLIIWPRRASVINMSYEDNKIYVKIEGYLKILSNEEYFSQKLNEKKDINFEYTVTFEKKFLFIWKATNLSTESNVIDDIMNGVLKEYY